MLTSSDVPSDRQSFLPPIPELDAAADLLSEAADALLAGDRDLARACLRRADMDTIHAWASRIMGPTDTALHRYRPVAGAAIATSSVTKAKQRMPGSSIKAAVHARDGYRCRFCGSRVADPRARDAMKKMVPDVIPWSAEGKNWHAAFYALTATIDHLVPHARGGGNDLDNLVTTCWPCNFGRGGWLIEEVAIIDPRTRPPIIDHWDGLTRMLTVAPEILTESRPTRVAAADGKHARVRAYEAWFAELDRVQPGTSVRLLSFLKGCEDLSVSWSLNKVLLVQMHAGDRNLVIFGIEPSGDVEIPWDIAGKKPKFRGFAEALAHAIRDAVAYETPKMWRVRKAGRRVSVLDLLTASKAVRTALEDLRIALRG